MFESIIRNSLLKKLKHIEYGSITITFPDNTVQKFNGIHSGLNVDIDFDDWRVVAQLMSKGDVGFAEDYRDEYWHTSNLEHLLLFALQNEKIFNAYGHGGFIFKQLSKLLYLTKRNSLKGSKKNIEAHYDLGNDFYKLWLDKTMTYSSAIFDDEISIEHAQCNKYNRLLDKIHKPHAKILEVGCGWGGFAELAGLRGYTVKGITLSKEQHDYAKNRTEHLNVDICLEDYRHQTGQYDAIVSIEMFEAVGEKYWNTYFTKLASLIKDDGKILLQIITIDDDAFDNYRKSADMIRTFIFPGGMLPCERELNKYITKNNLIINDIYRFGKDYAKTLRVWLDEFDKAYHQVKELGFDDKFIRIWRFYLALCSAGFEFGRINVIQLELSKNLTTNSIK